jgi:cell division protein ZapA (FtsZ GTPase activity inhibitor)
MDTSTLRISLLGTSFTIQTDEDPVYLSVLLKEFKEKSEKTQELIDNTDPLKIAIVTGVLLLDELKKEKQKAKAMQQMAVAAVETEKITGKLITMLEKSLNG